MKRIRVRDALGVTTQLTLFPLGTHQPSLFSDKERIRIAQANICALLKPKDKKQAGL